MKTIVPFVFVALAAIASAQSCPSIAGAPTGVTLDGIPHYLTTFDCGPASGGVNNITVSLCGVWQSNPMQQCGQTASHIVASAGCDAISFDQIVNGWYWGADSQAHVAYVATTSPYFFGNVNVGCGTSPLSLQNVTAYENNQGGWNWTFSLESSYVCASPVTYTPMTSAPSGSGCSSWTSCYDCTTAPSGNCGWCANSNTCSQGTATGPNAGSCISWDWLSNECPATPPPTTMAPDHCTGYTTCATCTTASAPYCGWCANTNTCSSGTANGPSTGSCISWDWVQNECPAGAGLKLPEHVGKSHAKRAGRSVRNLRSKP